MKRNYYEEELKEHEKRRKILREYFKFNENEQLYIVIAKIINQVDELPDLIIDCVNKVYLWFGYIKNKKFYFYNKIQNSKQFFDLCKENKIEINFNNIGNKRR